MTHRVALVGVFHETNTFSPLVTDSNAFARTYRGAEWTHAFAGTRTVGGGFLDGAREHGLETVPVFGAYATPAGMVTASAFGRICDDIVAELNDVGPVDGVLLELHGAMVVDGVADAEEEVVRLLREHTREVPVAAVLDLHANLGTHRLSDVDVLIGYRTNPHVDTYQRGVDAATHLNAVLSGTLVPYRAHRGVPVIAAPVAQRSDRTPLGPLLDRAQELERDLVDVTVHAGYAYADAPHLGMGISVTGDRSQAAAADSAAEELAQLAWESRREFAVRLAEPAAAFEEAAGLPGSVGVADTGDNINGGSPGDGTWLLAQAVQRPAVHTLATVWDPSAVQACAEAGVGARVRQSIGGLASPTSGEPVWLDATVGYLGSGRFTNRGPMATGARVDMGQVAVLRSGALDVVVQSRPVQPNDPEMFRSVGLAPEDYEVVLLKGAAALRAGWEPVVDAFVDAGTPGVCDSDLARLRFQRAPAELYPLTE